MSNRSVYGRGSSVGAGTTRVKPVESETAVYGALLIRTGNPISALRRTGSGGIMRRDEARRSRLSTLAWLAGACALALAAAMGSPASSVAAKVLDWGGNSVGQLGNGTTTNSDVPVAVTGLGAVKQLAEDGQSAYALLKTGTVEAWGDNRSGELGQGPSEHEQSESLVPEPVKGIGG